MNISDVEFLFLDVDGVLNNTMCDGWFDNYNLANLKHLCGLLHGPRIILSSDWRRDPKSLARVRLELNHIGLDIFGCTPCNKNPMDRAEEISSYLNNFVEKSDSIIAEQSIILDDMESKYVDPELPNVFFFRTQHQFGLTEEDVDFIMRFMNERSN